MKARLNLVAAGMLLAAVNAGFSQPVITNQPQTQATAPGTTVTFAVGASGATPLTYQWRKNVGAGFLIIAGATNAALIITNAQSWDAADYDVVLTNGGGAVSSAMAHLYVMSPGRLINIAGIDNFDDNKATGWNSFWRATLAETDQQLTVRGYWPGVHTVDILDTIAGAYLGQSWSVPEGQTLEWRVDLVSMNEHATSAILELLNSSANGGYALFKGRDFIHVCKPYGGHIHFVHEKALIRNTNVVLALALTRLAPNLILTARILDKANANAVLYERSVVDTPDADRSLTPAEMEAASGMRLNTGRDVKTPPWSAGSYVGLHVWQYSSDGAQPPAEVTFDNLELRTYKLPTTRYVDAASANPTPPYTNWATAARIIQDAVDAASAGEEIIVTNGLYASGGRPVVTSLLVNRVAVDKPLTLRSVNGPQFTIIQGYQVPGTTNGDGAIRCVYQADGARLSGFTLTNGATRADNDFPTYSESSGGALWCESIDAVVSNCVLSGNSAWYGGGGASGGTLNNCTLTGNSANGNFDFAYGGGAWRSTLNNCTLTANSAPSGGGAHFSTLNSCTLSGNSAHYGGGGASWSTLNNCTLTGNSAGYGGGANHGMLNNCTVSGNSAHNGGGLAGPFGIVANNCTLTGNYAVNSGGGADGDGAGTLNNCTLIGNSAGQRGGGVRGFELNNCIVYFNTAPEGANFFQEYGGSLNYSCTTPMPTNGVGNITNAPLFVNQAGGNLRLQFNSPCINAGLNAYAPGPTDLDGRPRIVGGTVDIGAYEFQPGVSGQFIAWLQRYGLPTDGSADAADTDQDGRSTWQEWRCQTNSTNALSVLRLLSALSAGTNVTMTWQSVAGVNYFLERSTNLTSRPPFWPQATGLAGQAGTTSFTDTNAANLAPLFYRVGVGP